jgi:hypothetical protein
MPSRARIAGRPKSVPRIASTIPKTNIPAQAPPKSRARLITRREA